MRAPSTSYVDSNGVSLTYQQIGEGPPDVVLMAGSIGACLLDLDDPMRVIGELPDQLLAQVRSSRTARALRQPPRQDARPHRSAGKGRR